MIPVYKRKKKAFFVCVCVCVCVYDRVTPCRCRRSLPHPFYDYFLVSSLENISWSSGIIKYKYNIDSHTHTRRKNCTCIVIFFVFFFQISFKINEIIVLWPANVFFFVSSFPPLLCWRPLLLLIIINQTLESTCCVCWQSVCAPCFSLI